MTLLEGLHLDSVIV